MVTITYPTPPPKKIKMKNCPGIQTFCRKDRTAIKSGRDYLRVYMVTSSCCVPCACADSSCIFSTQWSYVKKFQRGWFFWVGVSREYEFGEYTLLFDFDSQKWVFKYFIPNLYVTQSVTQYKLLTHVIKSVVGEVQVAPCMQHFITQYGFVDIWCETGQIYQFE